jgi:2-oxoglutarate/2-oxoacid ferredoxin oxidoreductase subunit beta
MSSNGQNGSTPTAAHHPQGAAPAAATNAAVPAYTKKDFESGVDPRWCPGCGDFSIINQVQRLMPTVGVKRENIVFISGIGCSSRFPYYMNNYGMHTIHGRAPSFASGLKISRPDLMVWIVTGDGDALAIGGNHFIHAMRRNTDLKVLMFNNRIYGLTKGQVSPTSELGKKTKTTPHGSPDYPFNPPALALGSGATFVARTVDIEGVHMGSVLKAAADHKGSTYIEIYQNCPVFNDGAFDALRDKQSNAIHAIRLEHGQPIVFNGGTQQVVRDRDGELRITAAGDGEPVIHDAQREDPSLAFALSRLSSQPTGPTPIGIFRQVERPVSGRDLSRELARNRAAADTAALDGLLHAGDTWTVS